MKRIFLNTMMMFVAVATLTLTSCTKEPEELIIGEWNVTSAQQSATVLGQNFNVDISKAFQSFEFQEDGTCIMKGYEMDFEFIDNQIKPVFGTEVHTTTCTYTLENNQLILKSNELEIPMIFNVDLLEKKEMNLSLKQSINEEGLSIDVSMTIALEK